MKLLFKKTFLGLIGWPLLKEKGGVMNTNVKSQAKQLQFHSLKTCRHITPVSRVLIQNCIYLMCERGSRRVSCVSYENLLKYLVSLELSMGHTISYIFK